MARICSLWKSRDLSIVAEVGIQEGIVATSVFYAPTPEKNKSGNDQYELII